MASRIFTKALNCRNHARSCFTRVFCSAATIKDEYCSTRTAKAIALKFTPPAPIDEQPLMGLHGYDFRHILLCARPQFSYLKMNLEQRFFSPKQHQNVIEVEVCGLLSKFTVWQGKESIDEGRFITKCAEEEMLHIKRRHNPFGIVLRYQVGDTPTKQFLFALDASTNFKGMPICFAHNSGTSNSHPSFDQKSVNVDASLVALVQLSSSMPIAGPPLDTSQLDIKLQPLMGLHCFKLDNILLCSRRGFWFLKLSLERRFFAANNYMTIVALDVGKKYTGVAVWHQGMEDIEAESTFFMEDMEEQMLNIKEKFEPVGFVVGFPVGSPEKDTPKQFSQAHVKAFLSKLDSLPNFKGMPICLVNEYGTSKNLAKRVKKFVEKDAKNWSGPGSYPSTKSFHTNRLQAKRQLRRFISDVDSSYLPPEGCPNYKPPDDKFIARLWAARRDVINGVVSIGEYVCVAEILVMLLFLDGIKRPDLVAWSSLLSVHEEWASRRVVLVISGFSLNGWYAEALGLFQTMRVDYIEANEFTIDLCSACLAGDDLRKGGELHHKTLRTGYG
ncbi:hypothetical protein WN943_007835 [Citrus x changshan-huyou]